MCLVAKKLEKGVLTEDLLVFKMLRTNGHSSNLDYRYEIGKVNPHVDLEIDVMLNYYANPHDEVAYYSYWNESIVESISKGYHFAFSKERLGECSYLTNIHEFTVPKGSTIYKDSSGLGVASQIIRKT